MGTGSSSTYPARNLYPDIEETGGLVPALKQKLAAFTPSLAVKGFHESGYYAYVASDSHSSQVMMAANERLFSSDFRKNGIRYGNFSSADLSDIARAIHIWIINRPTLAEMRQRFSRFIPSEEGEANEEGRTVEYQWASLYARWKKTVADSDDPARSPVPLIEGAMKAPELRQLYPFTSLYRLHFSRVTGYPFTHDCPHALPLGNGRYRACSAEYRIEKRTSEFDGKECPFDIHEILGEGTADEVIALIVANLPPGCGPAVDGTAETIGGDR